MWNCIKHINRLPNKDNKHVKLNISIFLIGQFSLKAEVKSPEIKTNISSQSSI